MGEQAAAATAGRGCNWIPRAGPHSQNKTHFHPIPSLPIHENSFSCAPAPTPNARLASDAGPSPQRLRKKKSSLLHSQKKGEKKKKPQRAPSPRKKPASFIKVTHIQKTRCGAGRYQSPLIYSRPHTPSFVAPYSTPTPLNAPHHHPNASKPVPESCTRLQHLSTGSAPLLCPPGRSSGGPRHPQPAEDGVGGWGPAAHFLTCQAHRSSGRSCIRRRHTSVSFNSRGSGATPLKLLPAPLPPKSRGAFPLASLPGPSGAHNSAPRTPFLHPVPAACAPHPAPCTRSSIPGASSATYGNRLSARSGTASRPRPMPPRNRTEPGLGGGRGRLAPGVTPGTRDGGLGTGPHLSGHSARPPARLGGGLGRSERG